MEQENKTLSPHQSLDLITQMIQQTKGNASNSSFYFLLWGWVVTICNFSMYGIIHFTSCPPQTAAFVWTLCIPAWIITLVYAFRQERGGVITHLDTISKWMWIGVGIAILPPFVFGAQINWHINAVILLMIGLATFVSGIIVRLRPLVVGGIVLWLGATMCFVVGNLNQFLVGGVAMILGYLVPGYLIRRQSKQ